MALAPGTLAARANAFRVRATLERDLRRFRHAYADLLAPKPPAREGVALFASLGYSTFQVKLEGMIAKALQFQGFDVVAAVPDDAELMRRYFRLFGVDRFVTLDDYAAGDVAEEAVRLLAGVDTAADLKAVEYRGADVGRQVLSTLSRYLHEGSVDLADRRAHELAYDLLPASLRVAEVSHSLLDDVSPDLVVFNERNYADQGPLSDVALA